LFQRYDERRFFVLAHSGWPFFQEAMFLLVGRLNRAADDFPFLYFPAPAGEERTGFLSLPGVEIGVSFGFSLPR